MTNPYIKNYSAASLRHLPMYESITDFLNMKEIKDSPVAESCVLVCQAYLDELKATWCDECGGYGHTGPTCGTYLRVQKYTEDNKAF